MQFCKTSLLLFLSTLLCFQALGEETQVTLEELTKRIDAEQVTLTALREEEKTLVASVAKTKKEYDFAVSSEKSLLKEISDVRKDETNLQSEFEKLSLEDANLKSASASRIRSLAKRRPEGLLHTLVLGGNASQISREVYLLRQIRIHDVNLLKRMSSIKDEMEQTRVRLSQLKEERIGLLAESSKKKNVKEEALKSHNGFLESLRERRRAMEKTLTSLKAEALRIESALRTLTVEEAPKSEVAPPSPRPSQFTGPGLKGVKLVLPIDGKVVKRFGSSNSATFADMLFKKGTEFVTGDGASPRAVARGLVLFAGQLPGYGGVTIVDHGERMYTLYGKLKGLKVRQGEVVEQGAPLGVTSSLDKERSNFYFEVRNGSQAVDPASYFGKGFKKSN